MPSTAYKVPAEIVPGACIMRLLRSGRHPIAVLQHGIAIRHHHGSQSTVDRACLTLLSVRIALVGS